MKNLKKVKDRNAIALVGDFAIEVTGKTARMDIRFPGGEVGCLQLAPESSKNGVVWGWDGNEDKPTLKSEIKTKNWSGAIVAGQFIDA